MLVVAELSEIGVACRKYCSSILSDLLYQSDGRCFDIVCWIQRGVPCKAFVTRDRNAVQIDKLDEDDVYENVYENAITRKSFRACLLSIFIWHFTPGGENLPLESHHALQNWLSGSRYT